MVSLLACPRASNFQIETEHLRCWSSHIPKWIVFICMIVRYKSILIDLDFNDNVITWSLSKTKSLRGHCQRNLYIFFQFKIILLIQIHVNKRIWQHLCMCDLATYLNILFWPLNPSFWIIDFQVEKLKKINSIWTTWCCFFDILYKTI